MTSVELSDDETLVLFEFFARFGDKGRLYFVHPAEYLALMKMSGQIDNGTSAMFDADYGNILSQARERIAQDFESDFPPIEDE